MVRRVAIMIKRDLWLYIDHNSVLIMGNQAGRRQTSTDSLAVR